jgi:hypothetical protein
MARRSVFGVRTREAGFAGGYSADLLGFDFKYADFGFAGSFDGVRRVSGDPEREARDRATIAALGPLLGGESLDDRSALGDRRCIDLNREDGWSVAAWRWLATERARDLAKHEPFGRTWRLIVLALHDLGEQYLELHGEQVDRFLADLPDAGPPNVTAAVPNVAASARRPGAHSSAARVADAALGVPRPTSLPAGVPQPSEVRA